MNSPGHTLVRLLTRAIRRSLVGPEQRWVFERPAPDWSPLPVKRTSLYLHVPFCRHFCPYCPYTKVPYNASLLAPYTRAAIAEVDWWAERIGPAEVTSIYIGGGTSTLALDSVAAILKHMRERGIMLGLGVIGLFVLGLFPQTVQYFLSTLPAMFEHLGQ